MKVFYDESMCAYSPVSFGKAGAFRVNEPKEVPDDIAKALIKKGKVKEYQARPENKEV